MPSALRFRVPPQGAGIGPHQENQLEWSHVYNLAGAANGYPNWSRQWNLTGFTHDTEFHLLLRNRGSGGAHLEIQKSTNASRVLAVSDSGLTTPLAITSTLATGTAPFVVASTTQVANLNATFLQGNQPSAFAAASHDSSHDTHNDGRYVNVSGDTMSGNLTVQGTLAVDSDVTLGNAAGDNVTIVGNTTIQQGLIVQQSAGIQGNLDVDGSFTLGSAGSGTLATLGDWNLSLSSNDLVWTDDGGVEKFRMGDASSTYAAKVTGPMHVTGNIELEGAIDHDGTTIGFFGSSPNSKQTVTGSRGGNAALASLLDALANYGLIVDSTS